MSYVIHLTVSIGITRIEEKRNMSLIADNNI